jgi:hypothetical protein
VADVEAIAQGRAADAGAEAAAGVVEVMHPIPRAGMISALLIISLSF